MPIHLELQLDPVKALFSYKQGKTENPEPDGHSQASAWLQGQSRETAEAWPLFALQSADPLA